MRTILLGAVVITALGCSAQIGAPEKPARARWMLRADPSLALIDPRCEGDACPRYPNPNECRLLAVEVLTNGSVCATCDDGETRTRSCGGPIRGIPYRCGVAVGEATGSGACLECRDVFGVSVLRDCGGTATVGYSLASSRTEPGEEGDGWTADEPGGDAEAPPAEGTCYDARRGDGSLCRLCVNADRDIIHDDCTTGGEAPPGSSEPPPAGGGSVCGPSSFAAGQQAFTDALNAILDEAGIDIDYTPRAPMAGFELDDDGYFPTTNLCTEIDEEIEDLIERRGPEWFREGQPRCGYIVTSAAGRVCGATEGCTPTQEGVLAEMTYASSLLDGELDCIGSPIVLDLDGDGIRTTRGAARFDLSSSGTPVSTAWIVRGDALLAIDRNGDGSIGDGREPLGDGTLVGSRMAGDGFEALAALDQDHDGDVDARDPEWARLRAWRDDGDAVTEPGELVSLAAVGIRRLSVEATRVGAFDDAGSILGLWSRFEREDGSRGTSCDVFFATGTPRSD